MASVLYQTIETLSRDKGIEADVVVGAVEDAIALATRKYYRTQENMRAEMDLAVVVSNCPQINNPCNGFNPTPVRMVVAG